MPVFKPVTDAFMSTLYRIPFPPFDFENDFEKKFLSFSFRIFVVSAFLTVYLNLRTFLFCFHTHKLYTKLSFSLLPKSDN